MHRMFTDDELVSRIPALLTICDGYIVHVADTGRLSATPLFVCFVCMYFVCVLCVCSPHTFFNFLIVHAMESLFLQSKRNLHSTHACKSEGGQAVQHCQWLASLGYNAGVLDRICIQVSLVL